MLPADNSTCVAIVVVTVVHLDASHSTPTGHTRVSVVPHAAYLIAVVDPRARARRQIAVGCIAVAFYFYEEVQAFGFAPGSRCRLSPIFSSFGASFLPLSPSSYPASASVR